MTKRILFVALVALLSGCKKDVQPVSVPMSAPQGAKQLSPCQELTYGGFPRSSPQKKGTFFICRDGYAINYDPYRKMAEWSVEHLTAENLNKPDSFKNVDDSRPDPQLAVIAQTQLNDYLGTGYERVRLVSSENFKYDDVLYSHTFYLSNAAVLNPSRMTEFKKLEDYARSLALTHKDVYVITGPLYEGGQGLGWVGVPDKERASGKNLNKGKIQVPTHYYKVLLIPSVHKAEAFVIPNTPVEMGKTMQSIPMETLETHSQIRFAPDFSKNERIERLGF